MKTKKILSLFISLLLLTSIAIVPNGISASAEADIEKPTIDVTTLTVSQKEASAGDTVRISVKVTDNVKVDTVRLSLISPITQKTDICTMKYGVSSDRYVYDFKITDGTESGSWKIEYIYACDSSDNSTYCHNSNVTTISPKADLSSADFTVSKYETPPVEHYDFEVTLGEKLNLSYEANCDIYWQSSDASIAKIGNVSSSVLSFGSYKKVVSSCEVIPIREGIVTIYAVDSDGFALNSAKVKVNKAEVPAIMLGDINSDGVINSTDALIALKHSVGQTTLATNQVTAGDVDKNGTINSSDALKILQYSVGQISNF